MRIAYVIAHPHIVALRHIRQPKWSQDTRSSYDDEHRKVQ